jgi:hypothetical protein
MLISGTYYDDVTAGMFPLVVIVNLLTTLNQLTAAGPSGIIFF